MQLAWWIGGVAVLFASATLAASGDALVVNGSNVNVRAGPSTDAGVLLRVGRDEPAVERKRQGQWVEIDLPAQDVRGWIHGSLLAPAAEQAARPSDAEASNAAIETDGAEADGSDAPAAEVTNVAAVDAAPGDEPLDVFRREVDYFNNRAVAAAGVDLFTGVELVEAGAVQVVTTEAWATMSAPGQQSYVNALFGRWATVAGDQEALRLLIVDPDGVVMMEKSEP